MLAPRPPGGGPSRSGAPRKTAGPAAPASTTQASSSHPTSDNDEAAAAAAMPSARYAEADLQRIIDEATGGDGVDWAALDEIVGRDCAASAAPQVAAAPGDDADGCEIVRARRWSLDDAECRTEVEVLAAFHDQDEAREILEARQTDIPEHCRQYWTRGVERELASLPTSVRSYKDEAARAAALRVERARLGEQMRTQQSKEAAAAEYATLAAAVRRLDDSVRSIGAGLGAAEEGLWEAQQRPRRGGAGGVGAQQQQQQQQGPARLCARLQDGIRGARSAEKAGQERLEAEAQLAALGVAEFAARRRLEHEGDAALLRVRVAAVQSKELARLTEEEADVRGHAEACCVASLHETFTGQMQYLRGRADRQASIAYYKSQLGNDR